MPAMVKNIIFTVKNISFPFYFCITTSLLLTRLLHKLNFLCNLTLMIEKSRKWRDTSLWKKQDVLFRTYTQHPERSYTEKLRSMSERNDVWRDNVPTAKSVNLSNLLNSWQWVSCCSFQRAFHMFHSTLFEDARHRCRMQAYLDILRSKDRGCFLFDDTSRHK